MKTYTVEIKETLQKTIEVKANSKEHAVEIVNEQWYKSEHILDADNFKNVTFTAKAKEKTKFMKNERMKDFMPNHITNIITFDDVLPERVNEIIEAIKNDEIGVGTIDFNKIIPMPEHIFRGNLGTEEKEKYGTDNWYDWSIVNWGTKWDSYNHTQFEGGDRIEFQTAWSAPHPVLRALTKQFPDVLIHHMWADEDFGYNVGEREYQDGTCIFENIPVGGSKEAYELAAQIDGSDIEELGYRLSEDGTSYEIIDDEELKVPDENIKVVLVKPMQKPIVVEIGSDLKSLQDTVGGYIEAIYPYEEQVALVCNEEGKMNGLPLNRAVKNSDGEIIDIIAGNFFVCDAKGENFGSLSEEQLKRYAEQFRYPEQFYKINDEIKVVPIKPTRNKDHER